VPPRVPMKAAGGARRAMKPQETRDRLNRNIARADLYLIACGFLYRSTEALSILVQVGAGLLHSKHLHSRTWFVPRGSASVKVQFPCGPLHPSPSHHGTVTESSPLRHGWLGALFPRPRRAGWDRCSNRASCSKSRWSPIVTPADPIEFLDQLRPFTPDLPTRIHSLGAACQWESLGVETSTFSHAGWNLRPSSRSATGLSSLSRSFFEGISRPPHYGLRV
jgi:hypothetical protein